MKNYDDSGVDAFHMENQSRVMQSYIQNMLKSDEGSPNKVLPWRKDLVPAIEQLRTDIRQEEGGGGMCHVVTEILETQKGWTRLPVTYLSEGGEVVCAGHLVSILPDGSLLDPTADQLGEGFSVRRIEPGDPALGRYRPEFDEEVNPVAYPEAFAGFFWDGVEDLIQNDRLHEERGPGWWLQDKSLYMAYLADQALMGNSDHAHWLDVLNGNRGSAKSGAKLR